VLVCVFLIDICFSVLLWMINLLLELSILCTRVIPFAEKSKDNLTRNIFSVSFNPLHNNENKYLTIYQVSQVDNTNKHSDDQDRSKFRQVPHTLKR
jgi:hypothetical protein